MIDPRLATLTTLADPNPLSGPALVQQGAVPGGAAQIPTGTVETKHEPSTERKIMGAETRSAMGALDTAYGDEEKALRAQKEADVQKEGIAAQGARAQADVAQNKEQALAELKKRQDDWRIQREAQREREIDDFLKVQKTTTVGDPSPIRQLVSALAVGMGQYAATMNGGPNGAWEIFKEGEENARNIREAQLKAHIERMTASGKSADERLKAFNQEHDTIEKLFAARNDIALKQAEALKVAVPSAAAAADVAIAKAKERKAELKRNFVTNYDETERNTGTTTQTSSGDKGGGRAIPDTRQTMDYANALENEKKALRLKQLVEKGQVPTPEELREITDRQNKIMASYEEEKKSANSSRLAQIQRALSILPSSIFPEGMSKEKREAYTLRWQLAEPEAIRATGGISWMTNPEAFQAVMGRRVHQPNEDAELGYMKDMQIVDSALTTADELRKVSKAGLQEAKQDARRAGPAHSASSATKTKGKVSGASGDYDFIVSTLAKDPNALSSDREQAFKEAIDAQKKARAQGKDDPRALRAMQLIRSELPKE